VIASELKWVRWRSRMGFPLAALCLWLARPVMDSILIGGVIAIAGLLVRAAASGHLQKGETVAMTGPYARTRNPLYFGSALLAAAFVVASRSWIAAAVVTAYYLTMYPFLMRREEKELRAKFGREFEEYARRVPIFWPRFRTETGAGGAQFSWTRYVRNREYQTALGTAGLLLGLWALSLWRS
jgi:protein-S-isoprenylcysteine O-methyltransferase Ste14